jgi:hypothetical protein
MKSDIVVQKLLLINHIDQICDDLLPIIKDYLFFYEITIRQRIYLKQSLRYVRGMFKEFYKITYSDDLENNQSQFIPIYGYRVILGYFHDIEENYPEYYIHTCICTTCGNYYGGNTAHDNAWCCCTHLSIDGLIEHEVYDDRLNKDDEYMDDDDAYSTYVSFNDFDVLLDSENKKVRSWGTLYTPLHNNSDIIKLN